MGKFKKGVFLGGLLGAGMMWLSSTKKGRDTRDKMMAYVEDVFFDVKEQIIASKEYDKLTKTKYVKMVQEYVDKYAVKNGMAESMKNLVVKLVSAQWKTLQKELKDVELPTTKPKKKVAKRTTKNKKKK